MMNAEERKPPVVAVLGAGTMGAAMAANIAKAGMGVRVWNRNLDRAAPLADIGATVCASPAEAANGADVVLTTLANEQIVAQVMDQARPAWSPQRSGYSAARSRPKAAGDCSTRRGDYRSATSRRLYSARRNPRSQAP